MLLFYVNQMYRKLSKKFSNIILNSILLERKKRNERERGMRF